MGRRRSDKPVRPAQGYFFGGEVLVAPPPVARGAAALAPSRLAVSFPPPRSAVVPSVPLPGLSPWPAPSALPERSEGCLSSRARSTRAVFAARAVLPDRLLSR